MVEADLRGRDITDVKVLEVMGRLPRQRFVPMDLQGVAYADVPLPIGHGQTISQPYIVALMTQAVCPGPKSRALDIGTGSGYQAAVLAELCKEVYSIEILKPLADSAQERLAEMGYKNVTVRTGDGYRGWPEKAPFDIIIVAAVTGSYTPAARRATGPRRSAGHPGGTLLPGTAGDREAEGRHHPPRVHCSGAIRPDARRGGEGWAVGGGAAQPFAPPMPIDGSTHQPYYDLTRNGASPHLAGPCSGPGAFSGYAEPDGRRENIKKSPHAA